MKQIKLGRSTLIKVILTQLVILIVWVLISILQWMKSPSNPGVEIPLVVRGIEAFSVFIIGLVYIYVFEKINFKGHEFKLRHGLIVLIALYIGSLASHILALNIRKLVGYSPPLLEIYKGYFFIRSTWFYLPFALNVSIFIYFKIVYIAQKEKGKKIKAEGLAQQAKWLMLRYQVNPHFLFNALNTVRAMIGVDDEKARKVITDMSQYFRYSLSSEEKETVTLEDEITAVENYLEIQKARFHDKLKVAIKISESSKFVLIPIFTVQMLVENALKYGLKTTEGVLEVFIESDLNDNTLILTVKNSGHIIHEQEKINGTEKGIVNFRERLEYIYPGNNDFTLEEKDGFVIAKIILYQVENIQEHIAK